MARAAKTKDTGGDVAVMENQAANLPAETDDSLFAAMEAEKEHRQHFEVDQLTIPRLVVLQDLSDEVKPHKAEYVEGAKPGLIFNKVQKWLVPAVEFVPSKFAVRYIAWQPRPVGGLVDQNLTREEVEENFKPDGIGRWVGAMKRRPEDDEMVRVEVIQTPEWVGMARPADTDEFWLPVAISFPVTKAKVVKDLNTVIDMTKRTAKDGSKYTPPAFFHHFKLDTAIETSGQNEYFNYRQQHLGWCRDEEVRNEAKALKLAFERGEVDVEDASQTVDG